MKPYEDPINFDLIRYCGKDIVRYERMSEIGQGSPVIGDMYINDVQVPGYRFGGPVMFDAHNIYAPVFVARFLTRGFKLAAIHRETLAVTLIGRTVALMYLYKLDGKNIFFYENIMKTKSNAYSLKEV